MVCSVLSHRISLGTTYSNDLNADQFINTLIGGDVSFLDNFMYSTLLAALRGGEVYFASAGDTSVAGVAAWYPPGRALLDRYAIIFTWTPCHGFVIEFVFLQSRTRQGRFRRSPSSLPSGTDKMVDGICEDICWDTSDYLTQILPSSSRSTKPTSQECSERESNWVHGISRCLESSLKCNVAALERPW